MTGYSVVVLENGDNIFSRWHQASQTVPGFNRASGNGSWLLTGGTGSFGAFKELADFRDGLSQEESLRFRGNGEYWMPK